MSKYIDAIDIAKQIADFKKSITSPNSDYMTGYLCAISVTEGMIANAMIASNADVVAVVRCRDCKHYGGVIYGGVCRKYSGSETKVCTNKDHYCSYAERSENGKS